MRIYSFALSRACYVQDSCYQWWFREGVLWQRPLLSRQSEVLSAIRTSAEFLLCAHSDWVLKRGGTPYARLPGAQASPGPRIASFLEVLPCLLGG